MELDFEHLAIPALGLIAAWAPFAIQGWTRMRSIAVWRQTVDDSLVGLEENTHEADKVLHKRMDGFERRMDIRDERDRETVKALCDLAEIAGRALGRTDGRA